MYFGALVFCDEDFLKKAIFFIKFNRGNSLHCIKLLKIYFCNMPVFYWAHKCQTSAYTDDKVYIKSIQISDCYSS